VGTKGNVLAGPHIPVWRKSNAYPVKGTRRKKRAGVIKNATEEKEAGQRLCANVGGDRNIEGVAA